MVATNGRRSAFVHSEIKTRTLVFIDKVLAPTKNLEKNIV